MLRIINAALRGITARVVNTNITNSVSIFNPVLNTQCRNFGALSAIVQKWTTTGYNTQHKTLLNHVPIGDSLTSSIEPINIQIRTAIKFSLIKGKRKTVKTVTKRFYRLNWGIWIRTKAGRFRHLWRKSTSRKKRLLRHVFCNAQQSTLLDKMTTRCWHRPHFYVDDPYNPYHEREEFMITRKKPLP